MLERASQTSDRSTDILLIYGPGAAGTRIASLSRERGIDVVLAGRNPETTRSAATSLGLPWRCAPLADPVALAGMLDGVGTVINTAGPYIRTAAPLMRASISGRSHYLDLSNEGASFRGACALDAQARDAGVSLVPGAGFGTAVAEALAAHVLTRIAEPDTVTLARGSTGGSKTAAVRASMLAVLPAPPGRLSGAEVRRDRHVRSLDLPQGRTTVIRTDTGDPCAIARATGIDSVRSYASLRMSPARARLAMPPARLIARLLAAGPEIRRRRSGPSGDRPETEESRTQLWIRATGPDGRTATSHLEATGAAAIAAQLVLEAALRAPARAAAGVVTAGQLIGTELILSQPGITITDD